MRRLVVKYAVDRVAAAVALIVLLPLLIGIAITVGLSVGRPVLFRQTRIGRGATTFEMLKFRTMLGGATAEEPENLTLVRDGWAPGGIDQRRLSRAGAFLRRASLDELPQLVNVLRGEMSLVGPRPERPTYSAFFTHTVPHYGDRHGMKPGITGWAQVNGLWGRTSIAERALYDSYYAHNCSLRLDLEIAVRTVCVLCRKWRTGE